MAGIRRWLVTALELALLGALLVGMAALFRRMSSQSAHPPDQQAGLSSDQSTLGQPYPPLPSTPTATPEGPYPPPINTEPLPDWITQPMETEHPTPTLIPFPTPLPTPQVTPIPLAEPPVIPSAAGAAPDAFTIIVRDGNTLRAVDSADRSERLLLDLSAVSPLYLNDEGSWGAASPDGKKLALVLKTQRGPWSKGQPIPVFSIHLFDIEAGQLQLLVEHGVEPVWSPDGNWIAYRDQNSGLSIIHWPSGEIRQVYRADQQNGHYVDGVNWAPTSDWLVFVDRVLQESSAIVSANIDGTEIKELVPAANYRRSNPQWSPSWNHVAFVTLAREAVKGIGRPYYSLWIIKSDGSEQAEITKDMFVMGKPAWSPDGEWIAFEGSLLYEEPEPLTELWLLNLRRGELKRLTSNELSNTNEYNPQWSPDRRQIICLRDPGELLTISLSDGTENVIVSTSSDYIILP